MSCALHEIGFRYTETIFKALDAWEWDAETRIRLLTKAQDIRNTLIDLPDRLELSPSDESALQDFAQSLWSLITREDMLAVQRQVEEFHNLVNQIVARVPQY